MAMGRMRVGRGLLGGALVLGGGALAAPTVSPTALLEVDHRTTSAEGGLPRPSEGVAAPGPNQRFEVGRFRAGVRLVEGDWNVQLTAEAVGGTLRVLDALAHLRLGEDLRLELGTQRGPVGALFHREPITTQAFSERAALELAFRERRDVGVGLNWEPAAWPVAVNLRVGDGSGIEAWQPALYLLLEGRFGNAHRRRAEAPWGLWVGLSGLYEAPQEAPSVSFNTPFGRRQGPPVIRTGSRSVVTAHAVGYVGPLRLRVEGALAQETAVTGLSLNPWGLTAEINAVLRGHPRRLGLAPRPPAAGPAVELSLRAENLGFQGGGVASDVDVALATVGAKAWFADWWALALVGFGSVPYDRGGPPPAVEELGLYLRASFFFGGLDAPAPG